MWLLRLLISGILLAAVFFLVAGSGMARGHPTRHTPYIVVLDPGHGGPMHWGDESGAVDASGTLLEKNMTLAVALRARTDLEAMGYRVYLTRTKDQHVNIPPRDWNHDGKIDHVDEMVARNVFADQHHADVFVSIHFDGSEDTTKHGTHGYWCPDRPFHRSNQRLATTLTASVVTALRKAGYADPNNGVQTDVADIVPQQWADYPWFLVLGPARPRRVVATAMPGALIETLYMSSPRDDAAMRKPAIVAAMAQGYADGIRQYFDGRVDR
jgi:N-acetylmuramoyl-L-alanine amidase